MVGALSQLVRKLPQQLRRSLTWDRRKERAEHKKFTIASGNRLSRFSQAYLNRIALRLNQRPGKTVGFEIPAYRLRAALH